MAKLATCSAIHMETRTGGIREKTFMFLLMFEKNWKTKLVLNIVVTMVALNIDA
jgi:hypothetical protein